MKRNIAGSQSVYRAIAVLRGVAANNENGITAKNLAGDIGLTIQTTHRILQVLVDEGMLTVDPFSKTYHLGLEIYQMGSAAHVFTLTDFLEGTLQKLFEKTSETIFLFIRSGTDSICLRRLDGKYPIRALTLTSGSRRPLGVGAGGLALLASLPSSLRDRIIKCNLAKYPYYFQTSFEEIQQDVLATKSKGLSFNDGRVKDGVRGIGMATGPNDNPGLCAISIATSDNRMAIDYRNLLETLLRDELNQIEWDLFSTRN